MNPRSLAPRSLLVPGLYPVWSLLWYKFYSTDPRYLSKRRDPVFFSKLLENKNCLQRVFQDAGSQALLPSVREVRWPGTFGKHCCRWLSTSKGSCSRNDLQNQKLPAESEPHSIHFQVLPSQTPETRARCTGIPYLPFSQL